MVGVPGDSVQGKQMLRHGGQTRHQRESSVSLVRAEERPYRTCQNLTTPGQRTPSPLPRVPVSVNGVPDKAHPVKILTQECPVQYLVHSYAKQLFILYLKFEFN